MIKIARIFSIWGLLFLFLGTYTHAQKINQLNAKGQRTGVWKKYYENGKIRYKGQFKEGKEIGIFKFYDITSSEHPTIIKEFSEAHDTARVTFYTLKGQLKTKGKMLGKLRIGKWFYYFLNKKIMSEENYTNGKLNGVFKNYYPNGKVTEETYYANGVKHGTSKLYTEKGTILEDVTYKEGKLHGEGKYYDLKGALKEKGNYKNGKKDGDWEFYIDGQISKKKKKEKLSEFNQN